MLSTVDTRKATVKTGNQMVDTFVLTALFVLGGSIVWSVICTCFGMVEQKFRTIGDTLLLFIYLGPGAMNGTTE